MADVATNRECRTGAAPRRLQWMPWFVGVLAPHDNTITVFHFSRLGNDIQSAIKMRNAWTTFTSLHNSLLSGQDVAQLALLLLNSTERNIYDTSTDQYTFTWCRYRFEELEQTSQILSTSLLSTFWPRLVTYSAWSKPPTDQHHNCWSLHSAECNGWNTGLRQRLKSIHLPRQRISISTNS